MSDLEARREALRGECTSRELRIVELLRGHKPAEPSPEQTAAYVELEHLLRGG